MSHSSSSITSPLTQPSSIQHLNSFQMFSFKKEGRVNSSNLSSLGRIEDLAKDWSNSIADHSFAIRPPSLSPMANTQAALLPTKKRNKREDDRPNSPLERFGPEGRQRGSPALVLHPNQEAMKESVKVKESKKSKKKISSPSKRIESMKPRRSNKEEEPSDPKVSTAIGASIFKDAEEPLSPFLVPRAPLLASTNDQKSQFLSSEKAKVDSAEASIPPPTKRKRDRAKEKKDKDRSKNKQEINSGKIIKEEKGGEEKDLKRTAKKSRTKREETDEEEYEEEASKRES